MLSYVKNLDASKIYGRMEGGINRMFENTRKSYDSHLADRGFDVAGGVHAEMFASLADQELRTKLEHQQKAEAYVLQTQQSVLNSNRQPDVNSTTGMQQGLMNQGAMGMNHTTQQAQTWDSMATTIGQGIGMMKKTERAGTLHNSELAVNKAKEEAYKRAYTSPTAREA